MEKMKGNEIERGGETGEVENSVLERFRKYWRKRREGGSEKGIHGRAKVLRKKNE